VTAESKGFKTEIRAGIHLQVDETSVVNFTMQLGTATESVTVTADTVLDFGKADIGDVVENARVTELPLNGRDPVLLAELAAGVVQGCSTCYQRPFDDNAQYTSINGGGGGISSCCWMGPRITFRPSTSPAALPKVSCIPRTPLRSTPCRSSK
jgi:hypothetical protein